MKIDKSYISSQNTYPYNNPQCIVVHNTDNFEPTANKKYCAGIAAAEWSGKLSGGSDLIKAMQKWAGVTADGYLGPQTIRALQKKLGTPVDGVISYPSAMVRALQEWCNRQ